MKQTVGKIASDLLLKPEANTVIDQQREMQKDYMKNLFEAVDRGYKKYYGNFFIHVEKKREPLLENVIRNYFIDRQTCPTPNYDQDIFRYNRQKSSIEYLWSIPDRETCFHLKANALQVVNEEKSLLNFVLQFDDGTLLKICKKLNNEKEDTPELKKG